MANAETAFSGKPPLPLDPWHLGMAQSEAEASTAGESWRASGEQGSHGGSGAGLPPPGHGLGPQMQTGRSCRGCLYFSRSLQDSGRDPLCVGITSAEAVPAAVFNKHSQMREQEAAEGNPRPTTPPAQQRSQPQDQHHRQQQKISNFERQQKILEDFRYACIGYSVYPTTPSHTLSSSTASRPIPPLADTGPKPPSSSTSSTSSRLPPPSSISFLIPAGAGSMAGVALAPELAGTAGLEQRARAQGGAGLASLLRADGSSSSAGAGARCHASSASTSTSTVPGGGLVEDTSQYKKPGTPPPLLPICVGIEILAGTKAPEKRDAAQLPNPQPLPHHREAHPPLQDQPDARPSLLDPEPSQPSPDRLPSWAQRNNPAPNKAPPVGPTGISAEEFTRRYIRAARLITKKCMSNFERLKGAVHTTVQDIFKGDK